jgi:hypothetical protein
LSKYIIQIIYYFLNSLWSQIKAGFKLLFKLLKEYLLIFQPTGARLAKNKPVTGKPVFGSCWTGVGALAAITCGDVTPPARVRNIVVVVVVVVFGVGVGVGTVVAKATNAELIVTLWLWLELELLLLVLLLILLLLMLVD